MAKRIKDIDKRIGNTVRKLRLSKNISQQKMGQYLGITFQQIQKYESGENRISSGSLYILAQHMGISVFDFFQDLERIQTKPELPQKMHSLMYDLHKIKNEKIKKSIGNLIKSMKGL